MARAALVPRALALALALAVAVAAEGPPAFGGPVAQVATALMDPAAPLPWRAAGLSALHSHPDGAWPDLSPNCTRDLALLASSFANGSIWAIKMFDASTKIPDGILNGNFIHMGNFDECLSLRKDDSDGPPGFDGQHCLVSFKAKDSASGDETLNLGDHWQTLTHIVESGHMFAGWAPWEHTEGKEKDGDLSKLLTYIPLQLAWCTPSTCTPQDLETIVNAAINMTSLKIVTASVAPSACHTHVGKPLRGIDIFAIWVLALFVAFAAASTVYDVLTLQRAQRYQALLAFSVYSNWSKLIAVTSSLDQISCINGIRTISMSWIVLAHVYMMDAMVPTLNIAGFSADFVQSSKRLVITNGTVSVDSFFMMSGLLLSFLFLKEVDRTNRFNIFKFYIHRYVRLTPALAILLLLTVTIIGYAGTGPLWDSRYDDIREACEKNWWTNLLYVNNYVHSDKMCLGHTWYLAVDMQLYWLSPLVLLPLWKLPKRPALLWIGCLLLIGWAIPFTIVYVMELSPTFIDKDGTRRLDTMLHYYYPVYTRYVPWLLGVLLGYILREARKKKPELPLWAIALGWTLSAALMLTALYAAYPFMQISWVYNRVESAFWLSLFRAMWSLGLGWIIFACDQGYGGIVDKILSWNFFQPLARLCYGIYLLHIPILAVFSGVMQSPIYLADINIIPQFFGVLVMTAVWTIPMVLLFETPIILIEKVILGGASRRQSEQQGGYQTMENNEADTDDSPRT